MFYEKHLYFFFFKAAHEAGRRYVSVKLKQIVLFTLSLCFVGFCSQGKHILTPSPISYAEEQLLHFFGQLLGIAIRADVPLPLDLLGSFWKGLVDEPLDPEQDLQEADILTYNYVKKFENVKNFSVCVNTSKSSVRCIRT